MLLTLRISVKPKLFSMNVARSVIKTDKQMRRWKFWQGFPVHNTCNKYTRNLYNTQSTGEYITYLYHIYDTRWDQNTHNNMHQRTVDDSKNTIRLISLWQEAKIQVTIVYTRLAVTHCFIFFSMLHYAYNIQHQDNEQAAQRNSTIPIAKDILKSSALWSWS